MANFKLKGTQTTHFYKGGNTIGVFALTGSKKAIAAYKEAKGAWLREEEGKPLTFKRLNAASANNIAVQVTKGGEIIQ